LLAELFGSSTVAMMRVVTSGNVARAVTPLTAACTFIEGVLSVVFDIVSTLFGC
jgi:hypothetical protein